MVRELESQTGFRLFERTTRSVSLTPEGKRFLPIASRTVEDLTAGVADLREMGAARRNRLRVGATPLVAAHVIPRVLRQLVQQNPDVRIEVLDTDLDSMRELIESGELDLGLGAFFERESGIRREAIFPAHLAVAMRSDQAPRSRYLRRNDLLDVPLIALQKDNPIQRLVDRHLMLDDERLKERRVVQYLETALALVAEGMGWSIVPSFSALAAKHWSLKFIPFTPRVSFDFYSIARAGDERRPLADAFLAEFLTVIKRRSGVFSADHDAN